MEQIFLFLDVDGVICTDIDISSEFLGIYQDIELFGTPSPLAKSFLQSIDRAKHISPFWMSSGWREHSIVWNQWAEIAPWTAGYPISFDKTKYVMAKYATQLALDEIEDAKTLAVLYHTENAPKIVWIEDGFPTSALTWAALDPRVSLINTIPPYDDLLLGIQDWNIKAIAKALEIALEPLQ